MVSSLLHVLIVTPVIFTWLREREIAAGNMGAMPIVLGTAAEGVESGAK
jgi:hypothetical protein